jgi:hypothetical protein
LPSLFWIGLFPSFFFPSIFVFIYFKTL